MNIGNRIAQKRRAAGLTQEAMAEKLGVSAQAVSKWENGQSCPDISLLPTIANLFGISIDELLTGETAVVSMVPKEERKPLEQLTMRVKIHSASGDKIRCNLPMKLVQLSIEIGASVIPNMGCTEDTEMLKKLDLSKIVEMVELGMIGKLVEIESANGDTVEIVVE